MYLDVGSNIGVQVRKLFEPQKYPEAKIHKIFNTYFGDIEERNIIFEGNSNFVCAVGLEPNYNNAEYLKEI